ncbi:glutathione S-transferase family protein [Alisedimentitalea sp. MJ-SS2]|uniref:glutathione S-transferase family protein n=1 Tax=Aliisedimentitalea sp. MJ-SS2 TaxID=3049795 RepID=UPI002911D59B|nr:glutathione S-transferase family protein [Alisedimentitalea sp. MJ-SS2]MDU8929281.1 glutathione S-transferase family protein [Alisedimentitalea sp. MJ-SS2]
MYEVIGSTTSRAFRVMWMLEELGQDYVHTAEKPRSELVTALNPSGKVPVFKDGDDVLTDSTAIISYLADKHGTMTHPCGTIARARQEGLIHQILDEIDAVLWTGARHSFILPEDKRVPEVKESLRWEFARNVKRMADRFEGPFLMGDEITVPDIILTHCLNWAFSAKFLHEEQVLTDYAKRMRGREAFKRAVAR